MTKPLAWLVVLTLAVHMPCFAQQKSHKALLDEKKANLENIMAAFTGTAESFNKFIQLGNEGMAITKADDHAYRFIFLQAIATGYYYKQNFDSARINFEQANAEALKANLIEKSVKPLGNLVSVYFYLGQHAKADSAAQQLKLLAETVDTLKNKSDIYFNLGMYNQQQKFFYSIALNNFLKSAELHKPVADTTKIIKLKTDYASKLMMVAEIYLYLEQPAKAQEYLAMTKPYLGLSKVLDVAVLGKFLRSYVQQGNKSEAMNYYDQLRQAAAGSGGKWSELVSSSLEIASLSLKEKDFTAAKLFIDKADAQAKLDNKPILTTSVNAAYGDYYSASGDYAKATSFYKVAEQQGAAIFNKQQYAELLKSLSSAAIRTGNATDAALYFDKYVSISDSLTQRKTALNIAEMEAIFQNKEKQQQIELQKTALQFAKKQRLLLIGGIILAGLIVLLLVVIYRSKKRMADILNDKNKKLEQLNSALEEANKTKAKLFSIIGHDLRSPISQIYQFLKLQQLNPDALSAEQKTELSNKIQTATGSLLETMEDLLLWSKTQMSEFKTSMQPTDVLTIVAASQNLLQLNIDARHIRIKNLIPENTIVTTDPYYLQTIIRNLLQNAVKASPENGTIEVGVEKREGGCIIYIKNEGGYFSQEQYREIINSADDTMSLHGLGLRLADELSKKINATVSFKKSGEHTTQAEILLKD